MRIYKKIIMYAAMDVDTSDCQTSREEGCKIDDAISEFETDISLDLDNMQEGGDSSYAYYYKVDDIEPKELLSEDSIAYAQLQNQLPVRYQFYRYDVWGNAEDGWQVNDSYEDGDIVYKSDDKDDLEMLKQIYPEARISLLEVDNNCSDESTIYIDYKTGEPFGEFRRVID